MTRLLKRAMRQRLDGRHTSSSLELDNQAGSSAKRPRLSSSQTTLVLPIGERHDGQSVPSRLYGYLLKGRQLEPAYFKRARRVTKRITKHLKAVASQLDKKTYKSMKPFPSSTASEATPDTAVHVKHGLVYRAERQASGAVHSSLMYTFYTPLDFLEYPPPQSVSNIWGNPL